MLSRSIITALVLTPVLVSAAQFNHVHMRAQDPARAAAWYAETMGGELTTFAGFDAVRFGDLALLFAAAERTAPEGSTPPATLETSAGSALDHLGFSVSDLDRRLPMLEAAGATVTQAPRDIPGVLRYAFIEDPWGQKVEVLQDPELIGFHHAHILARDPQAAIGWYQQAFGGEVVAFKDLAPLPAIRYGDFWIIASATDVALRPSMFTMLDHLGWSVADIDNDLGAITQGGARVLRDPSPAFWWQAWIPFYRGPYIAFIESPDGVMIEVVDLD